MNFILILLTILILIIVIFTIIDKYTALSFYNDDKNDDKNDDIYDDKIFIKYSSINNKLLTVDDYINLHYFINDINKSIYISEIQTNQKNSILELITNDIQKTKLKYNFNKLKNIFVIIKKIEDNIKIILFYDGLLYNSAHFKFKENDYSGYTIVYKLDLNNKLFNHYLQ